MKYYSFVIIALLTISSSIITTSIDLFYNNAEILVTGGAGFIGSHLVEKLIKLNAHVTVLDNLSSGDLNHLQSCIDKIQFIQGSVSNFNTCLAAAKNKKIIFHLAALVSVPESMKDPFLCHYTNDIGTLNMLEAARIHNVERFVFSSSCAVYGETSEACSENDICYPKSPYGISKYIGEQYCKEYNNLFHVKTVILRYFNVFGNRQSPHGAYAAVVAKFSECMQHDLPITIYGDGTQTRDFVSVDSVVEANLFFGAHANESSISGEIFNIATGKSTSIITLFDSMKKNYPQYIKQPVFSPERSGDIKHVRANITKYQSVKEIFNI